MATYEPDPDDARAPARLDPGAGPRRLGLRDQRRRLLARGLRRDRAGDRRRPALRRSRARSVASASTRTSSGRCGWLRRDAAYVALSDQDDRWHPDKLERARRDRSRRDPGATLAYSDMRIADGEGRDPRRHLLVPAPQRLRRHRLAGDRQHGHRRGLALPARAARPRAAVPARRSTAEHYHDHWLALCALATGEIAYLDRPTYDYTRHGESVTLSTERPWFAPPRNLGDRAAHRVAPLDPPRAHGHHRARLARRLLRPRPADAPVVAVLELRAWAAHRGRQAPRPGPAGERSSARRGPRHGCSAAAFAR